jgi:hypothetical protein
MPCKVQYRGICGRTKIQKYGNALDDKPICDFRRNARHHKDTVGPANIIAGNVEKDYDEQSA